MNGVMKLAPRYLFPLIILAYLPLACSSDNTTTGITPPPPAGGSATGGSATGGSATGGSSGTATGGSSSGTGGMSGGSGGAAGGKVDPGGACVMTSDCRVGSNAFCKTMVCSCPSDKPDTCGAAGASLCTLKTSDPDNCGMCGTKCDAGATCVAGTCGTKPTELTTSAGCGSIRMAIQGTALYWVESMSGKVRSMPLAGGAVTEVATAMNPTQIAVDAKGVYWVSPGDGTAANPGKVFKAALPLVAGAAPIALATATATGADMYKGPDSYKIRGLAVHANFVYYALRNDVHQISNDQAVTTDLVVGTAVNYDNPAVPIVDGEPTGLAVNDTVALWTTGTRNGVESHTLNAVVVPGAAGYVKLAKSVGALLFNGDVSIDATNGYWADGEKIGMDTLVAPADAIAGDNSSHNKVLTAEPNSSHLTTFTTNAMNVYFAAENGLVFRHSLVPPVDVTADPTPPVSLARDQMKPTAIAVDAAHVYWATSDCAIRSAGL